MCVTAPAHAVRGESKQERGRACCTSIPRARRSVVMRTRLLPLRNSRMMTSRTFWSMSPCVALTVKSFAFMLSVSQSTCSALPAVLQGAADQQLRGRCATFDSAEMKGTQCRHARVWPANINKGSRGSLALPQHSYRIPTASPRRDDGRAQRATGSAKETSPAVGRGAPCGGCWRR